MAGCGMHEGGMGAGMAGCGMHEGGMGAGMAGCGMKPGMGPRMAGPGMRGGPMGRGACGPGMGLGCGPEMMRALELKDEQQKKIAAVCEQFKRVAIQKQAELRIAMLDLGQLARAEKPDKARLDAQIEKVARMRADLQKARVGAMLEMRSVLTPSSSRSGRPGPLAKAKRPKTARTGRAESSLHPVAHVPAPCARAGPAC